MTDSAASEKQKVNPLRRAAERVFGGFNMSWPAVIIFAVAAAVATAIVLILPVFDNTSFREMGVYFEAWIFFAVFIMVNCKKPLESALKTFVFFLISQPLIYLIQVPFSDMGWGLFGYYRLWFILTLCTFPAAYVGWYIKKGNWLSLLIITPANLALAYMGFAYIKSHLIPDFPNHLISVLFCFGQIVLYLLVLFRGWRQRLAGAAAVILLVVILILTASSIDTGAQVLLPGDPAPVLSEQATVRMEDDSYGEAALSFSDGEAYLEVHMIKYGSVRLIVTDGDKEYYYLAEAVTEKGTTFVEITPVE